MTVAVYQDNASMYGECTPYIRRTFTYRTASMYGVHYTLWNIYMFIWLRIRNNNVQYMYNNNKMGLVYIYI